MPTMDAQVDLKSLEALETKIQKTVDLVRRLKEESGLLRDENVTLRAQIASFQMTATESAQRGQELDAMRITTQQMERELSLMRDERQTVVSRVDSLLGELDRLNLD